MAYIDILEERPGVTGVLLGIVLRFSGDFVAAQIETIAMLLFAFGVVAALYSEDWWRRPGRRCRLRARSSSSWVPSRDCWPRSSDSDCCTCVSVRPHAGVRSMPE